MYTIVRKNSPVIRNIFIIISIRAKHLLVEVMWLKQRNVPNQPTATYLRQVYRSLTKWTQTLNSCPETYVSVVILALTLL